MGRTGEIQAGFDHQWPASRGPAIADPPSGLRVGENAMTKKNRASQLVMLGLGLVLPLTAQVSLRQQRAIPSITGQSVPGQSGQTISEQKKAVVFIFGTIHPLNPDNSAMRDIQGNRVAVNVPLGTGFFVGYPDRRLWAGHNFSYLVTAKHVLQDVDGTFL